MGFPILQGSPTISTRPIRTPEPVEEYAASDRADLSPGEPLGPWAIFAYAEFLNAVISISYYDMIRSDNNEVDCWTVEVRIQIVPSCGGISEDYREPLYRIELPESSYRRPNKSCAENRDNPGVEPIALFSNDQRFLSCLIPHPYKRQLSSLVVFQLRKPKPQQRTTSKQLSLPSYMTATDAPSQPSITPVATNPRMVKSPDNASMLSISAICFCGGNLIAGTHSGRLFLISCRPVQVIGQADPFRDVAIISMHAWKAHLLAVVYADGIVSCFRVRTGTTSANEHSGVNGSTKDLQKADSTRALQRSFAIRSAPKKTVAKPSFLERTHYSMENCACRVCWLDGSHLAMLDTRGNSITVRCIKDKGDSALTQQLFLDPREIREAAHTSEVASRRPFHAPWFQPSYLSLSLDPWKDSCLAVSTTLFAHASNELSCHLLWNWRINAQGYTAAFDGSLPSSINFARQRSGPCSIVRLLLRSDGVIAKDTRRVALLSPPNCTLGHRIRPASPLLLASDSISYLSVRRSCALENFEIHWKRAMIPKQYTQSFGCPNIAAFASEFGRSAAVASSRGLCVLECCGPFNNLSGTSRVLQSGRLSPRWHRFSNPQEERLFRVISFAWWEQVNIGPGRIDDLLLAVIEVVGEGTCYLCCWPSRDIGKHRQLLKSISAGKEENDWGVELPESFQPTNLDVLACPIRSGDSSRACVLLTCTDDVTQFAVCRLQTAPPQDSNRLVHCHIASFGVLNRKRDLFLAGANFAYDLRRKIVDCDCTYNVATAGAIHSEGVDAYLLSTASATTVRAVLDQGKCEVVNYWLCDIVREEATTVHSFSWTFELNSGKLVSWWVPTACSFADEPLKPQAISHSAKVIAPECFALGVTLDNDDSSVWSQKSSPGSRKDFLVGSAPSSHHGFVVGIAQSVRKITLPAVAQKASGSNCMYVFECSNGTLYPSYRLAAIQDIVSEDAGSESTMAVDIERYLKATMRTRSLRRGTILCVQVLLLQTVDRRVAKSSRILTYILRGLHAISSPLQFSAILLQVGRQLEASALECLFPVQIGNDSALSIDDLFRRSLNQGSLHVALSAIPILNDSATTLQRCTDLFRLCLNFINSNVEGNGTCTLDPESNLWCEEEKKAIGDIFRYALKIDEPDDDVSLVGQHSSRYSLACGIPQLVFGRKNPKVRTEARGVLFSPRFASNPPGRNFKPLKPWEDYRNETFPTILATAAHFVLSKLFWSEPSSESWSMVSVIAKHVIGNDAPFQRCSVEDFSSLMEDTPLIRYKALEPDLGALLLSLESSCFGIGKQEAQSVVDFCLVLLGTAANRCEIESEAAGLVVVAIVAAYNAGTLGHVVDFGRQYKSPVWSCFQIILNESSSELGNTQQSSSK